MRCSPPQTPSTTCSNSATPWSSISTCGRQKNIWSGETWGAWSHHHRSNTKRLHDWPGPTLASSALSSDKNLRIEYKPLFLVLCPIELIKTRDVERPYSNQCCNRTRGSIDNRALALPRRTVNKLSCRPETLRSHRSRP